MRGRAGVILIEGDRVAMIERTRPGLHYYVFPGGGVDPGETYEEAAMREAHEELGVEVELIGTSVARMRTPGEHRYWRARVSGGTFGEGHGREFKHTRAWSGSYTPVWIELSRLEQVRVIPRSLASFIVACERDGWPAGETTLVEWAWLERGPERRSADPFASDTTTVVPATPEDIPAWLDLAREVEDLFGAPMSRDEAFRQTLERKVAGGTAYCVRENWGGPGIPLAGALLWRPNANEIGWLAVARRWQRRGIGSALLRHVVELTTQPEIRVTTFARDVVGGEPARAFYLRHGFVAVDVEGAPDRESFALLLEEPEIDPPTGS